MGNIRTADIKKVSFQLIETYPDKFSHDFEQNKQSVNEANLNSTKMIRNKVAGYITRIMSQKKKV